MNETWPIPTCKEAVALGFHIADWLLDAEAELGPEPVREFLREHAGNYYYVRKAQQPSCGFLILGSMEAWMSERFITEQVTIPVATTNPNIRRRAHALKLFREGRSTSQIARALGITVKYVPRLKAQLKNLGLLDAPSHSAKETRNAN